MDLIPFEYEVVTVDGQGMVCRRTSHQNVYFAEDLGDGVTLKMVRVPGGSFQMGATPEDREHFGASLCKSLEPRHTVNLSPFMMGMTPVTQAQFHTVMGHNPSSFRPGRPYYPVNNVSWSEAIEFCERLSALTGHSYRLPSEAEWEYACRAGTTTAFHFGPTVTEALLNYGEDYRYILEQPQRRFQNSEQEAPTLPVNAFGLYDLHYSVWEWCEDHWHDSYENSPDNGSAWIDNGEPTQRVLRGGLVQAFPHASRSSERYYQFVDNRDGVTGFRVCCSAPAIETAAEVTAAEVTNPQNTAQNISLSVLSRDVQSEEVQSFHQWLEVQSITDCLNSIGRILQQGEAGLRSLTQKLGLPSPLSPFEYEVVSVNPQGHVTDRAQRQNVYFGEPLDGDVIVKMVMIPGGQFWMGTESAEVQWLCDTNGSMHFMAEEPHHRVSVPSFAIAMTPITKRQYQAVMGRLPGQPIVRELPPEEQGALDEAMAEINAQLEQWLQDRENQAQWAMFQGWMESREAEKAKHLDDPVECVSHQDVLEFCEKLSAMTGRPYRLPSEAEWEYACRANTETPFYFGETITTDLANYCGVDKAVYGVDQDLEDFGPGLSHYGQGPPGSYREAVTAVGQFSPNAFGLYDMHGTVWEWCADDFHRRYDGAPVDGSPWTTETGYAEKVLKGGAWYESPGNCRSGSRRALLPGNAFAGLGFRVCLSLPS